MDDFDHAEGPGLLCSPWFWWPLMFCGAGWIFLLVELL